MKHSHNTFVRFLFVLCLLWLTGCATRPDTEIEQVQRIERLTTALQALAPSAPQKTARHFAATAVEHAAALREQYDVRLTPWLHNMEVNSGLRERGLCHQYAKDMAAKLLPLAPPYWQIHYVQAHRKTPREHNAISITAAGESWDKGIVLDAWRHAGVLYFGPVTTDKYPWRLNPKRKLPVVTSTTQP